MYKLLYQEVLKKIELQKEAEQTEEIKNCIRELEVEAVKLIQLILENLN